MFMLLLCDFLLIDYLTLLARHPVRAFFMINVQYVLGDNHALRFHACLSLKQGAA